MLLNRNPFKLQLRRGLQANINANNTKNSAVVSEPHYTTDSNTLYIFNGTVNKQAGMRFTSSNADPTTTEIPNSGEFGIHKNTTTGFVYFAYNDGGSIVKIQLI